MFSIGQFSRITELTIKTIRLYHEKELLIPKWVDATTGYRYFDDRNIEQARAISYLRELMFPLSEIKGILDGFSEDSDILSSAVPRDRIGVITKNVGSEFVFGRRKRNRRVAGSRSALERTIQRRRPDLWEAGETGRQIYEGQTDEPVLRWRI